MVPCDGLIFFGNNFSYWSASLLRRVVLHAINRATLVTPVDSVSAIADQSSHEHAALLRQLYEFNLEETDDTVIETVKFFCNVYKTDVVVIFVAPSMPPTQSLFRSNVQNPQRLSRVHVLFDTARGVPWLLQPTGNRTARARTPPTFRETVDVARFQVDEDEARTQRAHYRQIQSEAPRKYKHGLDKSIRENAMDPRVQTKSGSRRAKVTAANARDLTPRAAGRHETRAPAHATADARQAKRSAQDDDEPRVSKRSRTATPPSSHSQPQPRHRPADASHREREHALDGGHARGSASRGRLGGVGERGGGETGKHRSNTHRKK